jgi:DNA ligase D-like protein (predicted ligase)
MKKNDPFSELEPSARNLLQNTNQPDWIQPMLATLTKEYFDHPEWIYEPKWDGERCLVIKEASGKVRLFSRNRKSLNDTYPELEAAFMKMPESGFIMDGEVVALDGSVSSFSVLQGRMQNKDRAKALKSEIPVYYYCFDLLYFGNHLLTQLPLKARKQILQSSVHFQEPVRLTSYREQDGLKYLQEACASEQEGLIAKDIKSAYHSARSKSWLKFKCVHQQEFVIGGFTEPSGSRQGFGALLVGYHDDNQQLNYAGKVGTGYNDRLLNELSRSLKELESRTSPFATDTRERKAHFVKPKLVCEVGFSEWTRDGKLRHPTFLGLREDKDPGEIVKES